MKPALAVVILGGASASKHSPLDAVQSLFTAEKNQGTGLDSDFFADKVVALKDAVLHDTEDRKNDDTEDRALQADSGEPECTYTEDGGQRCCLEIMPGSTLCLAVWCDATEDCTCETYLNEQKCDVCLLCDEGAEEGAGLSFDCSSILFGLEASTCTEETTTPTTAETVQTGTTSDQSSNPGSGQGVAKPTDCHPTDDGNYECCDYSTGTAVCITLEVSVKPAGSSSAGTASPGPPPTGNGCSSIDSSSYNICIDADKTGTYTMDWTNVALMAKAKWESVIVGNLSPGDIRTPEYPPDYACGTLPPVVDDLYICFKDPAIDGFGGVLGGASPVFVRTNNSLPISGYMEFDSADIQNLIEEQTLEDVFTHEMGHVVGFGSLLQAKGLVSNEGTEDAPDYVYKSGTKACEMWQEITGCDGCPPIENEYGQGTAGSHWDEDVMGHEMMTGFKEDPQWDGTRTPMPLSKITLGALEDLGYAVDYSMADDYPTAPQCGGSRRGLRSNVRFLGKKKKGKKGHRNHHNHHDGHGKALRKNLSDVRRAMAIEYGKQRLVAAQTSKPVVDPEGAMFVADRFISVIVEDGGDLFSVDLFSDA